MTTRTLVCTIAMALVGMAGCRFTPGGGPLRDEWMDHHPSDRKWILQQYYDPHLYTYHRTHWLPMNYVGAGHELPLVIEPAEELLTPNPDMFLPPVEAPAPRP